MDFPCPNCGASTQFMASSSTDPAGLVVCVGCGSQMRVAIQTSEPSIDQEEYRRAQLFARENQVDLATAYSVLEGLFTLEEARGDIELRPAPAAPARARPAPNGGRRNDARAAASRSTPLPAYDEGFSEAIRDGCLTAQQAIDRGDRQALVSRLAARHLLPMDLALQAADHRITIRQAIQLRVARANQERSTEPGGGRSGLLKLAAVIVGTAAILTLAAVRVQGLRGGEENPGSAVDSAGASTDAGTGTTRPEPALMRLLPDESERVQVGTTTSKSDAEGRLLKVAGPDPRSVLAGFCTSGRRSDLKEAVGIAELGPRFPGERLGIFRNPTLSNLPPRAIRIQKDAQTGEWIAGDGVKPIPSEPVLGSTPAVEAKPKEPSPGTTAASVEPTDAG